VDEERILAEAKPDDADDISEEMFNQQVTEEEAIFNNQLNEIDEFENTYHEEEKNFAEQGSQVISHESPGITETIPSIFDTDIYDEEEEILIEEDEEQYLVSNVPQQGEMITETSNIEDILTEIKMKIQTRAKRRSNC
jgi:glucuronate isomerase